MHAQTERAKGLVDLLSFPQRWKKGRSGFSSLSFFFSFSFLKLERAGACSLYQYTHQLGPKGMDTHSHGRKGKRKKKKKKKKEKPRLSFLSLDVPSLCGSSLMCTLDCAREGCVCLSLSKPQGSCVRRSKQLFSVRSEAKYT